MFIKYIMQMRSTIRNNEYGFVPLSGIAQIFPQDTSIYTKAIQSTPKTSIL